MRDRNQLNIFSPVLNIHSLQATLLLPWARSNLEAFKGTIPNSFIKHLWDILFSILLLQTPEVKIFTLWLNYSLWLCSNLGLTIHIVVFLIPFCSAIVQYTMVWWSSCSQEAHHEAEEKCRYLKVGCLVMAIVTPLPTSKASYLVLFSKTSCQNLQRSKDLLWMAGMKGSLHDFSHQKSGGTAAVGLKLYNHGKFFTCWDKPPMWPRMRTHLSKHQSCCIWSDSFEMVNFEKKKVRG